MSDHPGKRLSAFIDGELGGADRERVLSHLARCEQCRVEARAMRAIKERMRGLGEATAGDALTRRLIAMAPACGPSPAAGGPPAWARRGRRRRARPVVVAGVGAALIGLGVPAAAFVAGGAPRHAPDPRVTPLVDVFMVQHAFTTGEMPVQPTMPSAAPSPPDVASQAP